MKNDSTSSSHPRVYLLLVLFPIFLFFLLHYLPLLISTPFLWGADSFSFLPVWLVLLFSCTGTLSFIPKIYSQFDMLLRILDKLQMNLQQKAVQGMFVILYLGTALLFSDRTHLLGDGKIILRDEFTMRNIVLFEPLESFIHSITYKILSGYFDLQIEQTIALLSYTAGITACVFIWRIVHSFGMTVYEKAFLFGALLLPAATQLYFNYVEYYSITAAVFLIYLYYYFQSLKISRYLPVVTFFAGLVCMLHTAMVFVSVSVVYLYYIRFSSKEKNLRLILISILTGCVPILITLAVIQYAGISFHDVVQNFSAPNTTHPVTYDPSNVHVGYSMFSAYHFIDFINLLILTIPFLFCCLPLCITGILNKRCWRQREVIGAALLGGACLLEAFVVNSQNGLSRDWDLFSVAAYPIGFLLFYYYRFAGRLFQPVLFPLLIVSFIHTAGFVLINTQSSWAQKRLESLAGNPAWSPEAQAVAYDELRQVYLEMNDRVNELKYAEKCVDIMPNSPRYNNNLGSSYHKLKRYADAEKFYRNSLSLTPTFTAQYNLALVLMDTNRLTEAEELLQYLYINKGDYYLTRDKYIEALMRQRKFEEAVPVIQQSIQNFPEDYRYTVYLALCYLETSQWDQAIPLLRQVIDKKPRDKIPYVLLGKYYIALNRFSEAIPALRQALRFEPEDVEGLFLLARALHQVGNIEESVDTYLHLNRLLPDDASIKSTIDSLNLLLQ